MKTQLILLVTLLTSQAFAHEGVELGPNGGRILEFSKDETMHGEVVAKDGKFHIALLDKNMKPVPLDNQTLTATSGTRQKPVRLEVSRAAGGFTLPLVPSGQWLILQYKETPGSKAVTARLEYNTDICSGCDKAEWLCQCEPRGK